jgi:glycosyltransferase involved in cell wall biosynthesis
MRHRRRSARCAQGEARLKAKDYGRMESIALAHGGTDGAWLQGGDWGDAASGAGLDLSVVVPVYRSSATLGLLLERLTSVLNRQGLSYEVVLVDDGSPDDSWARIEALYPQYSGVMRPIRLMRNYGQHNALMCGLKHSRGRYVVTMDDDLQNPPEEIPKLIDRIKLTQADLVYGVPADRKHAQWRNLGSLMVKRFYQRVFRSSVNPTQFRIMERRLVDSVLFYDLNFTYLDGLLAWCTQSIAETEVDHAPRQHGRSGYNFSKLLSLALNLYTNFSLIPLQVVSLMGVLASAAGFATALYFLAQRLLSNIAVPGYASTIVAVLILGGLQLLALGIMGEYLGRLHLNVNRKPQYLIRTMHVSRQPSTVD